MTALRLRGFLPVTAPVLDFHPTDAPLPKGPFDALVFTSANGVAAFAGRDAGRDLPVFAVGGATAAAARKAQFARIVTGEAGAAALAEMIHAQLAPGSHVLHAAGRDVAVDLAPLLTPHGIRVTRAALYAMEIATALPDTARDAIAAGCFVLLHSPRSAGAFGALAGDVSRVTAICQSGPIAAAAGAFGFGALATADHPTESAMLDCLEAVKAHL